MAASRQGALRMPIVPVLCVDSTRCCEDSEVLYIDQATVRELYYQNPSFGFELIGLVAARLSADVARLENQLARQAATS
jgi:CRP-like cAMP-binding protein